MLLRDSPDVLAAHKNEENLYSSTQFRGFTKNSEANVSEILELIYFEKGRLRRFCRPNQHPLK